MHPIVAEQIARSRMEQFHREAAVVRRSATAGAMRPPARWRLALAASARAIASRLDGGIGARPAGSTAPLSRARAGRLTARAPRP